MENRRIAEPANEKAISPVWAVFVRELDAERQQERERRGDRLGIAARQLGEAVVRVADCLERFQLSAGLDNGLVEIIGVFCPGAERHQPIERGLRILRGLCTRRPRRLAARPAILGLFGDVALVRCVLNLFRAHALKIAKLREFLFVLG